MMVNNSTNINKVNNHLSHILNLRTQKKEDNITSSKLPSDRLSLFRR